MLLFKEKDMLESDPQPSSLMCMITLAIKCIAPKTHCSELAGQRPRQPALLMKRKMKKDFKNVEKSSPPRKIGGGGDEGYP